MRSSFALVSGLLLGLPLLLAGGPAYAKVRVAVYEFQLDGSPPPALGIQLQDGFILGLVRAGVQVLDPTDTSKKLDSHPELQRCDSSPCLKAIGQLLDVGHIVRVKIEVAGNSYKTVARLYSTEGAAPAALPIATESKSCDVCTVADALAIGAGFAVLASNGDCTATSCDANRTRNAAGGVLIGAGAALTVAGAYVTIVRGRGGEPVTGVAVAMRW